MTNWSSCVNLSSLQLRVNKAFLLTAYLSKYIPASLEDAGFSWNYKRL